MNPRLRIGQRWQHHSGRIYTIKALANLGPMLRGEVQDPKFPPMVVYEDEKGDLWSRRLGDWREKFSFVDHGIPEPNVIHFDTRSKENRVIVIFSDGHTEEYDRDDKRFREMRFKTGDVSV